MNEGMNGSPLDPPGPVTNIADHGAAVGVQAQAVHGDINVTLAPDASPQERFDRGVFWLNGGVPEKAAELIEEAIEGGLAGSEVGFHWLLSLLSGRDLSQLSEETLSKLRSLPEYLCRSGDGSGDDVDSGADVGSGDDPWSDGLRMILSLLEAMDRAPASGPQDAELRSVLEELDGLAGEQRALILRHLELFLAGPLQDQLWDRAVREAERQRWAGDRVGRAWTFFHPDPAPPRVLPPRPIAVSVLDRVTTALAAIPFTGALLYLGATAVASSGTAGIVGCLFVLLGGYAWAEGSLAVHVGAERVGSRDRQHTEVRQLTRQAAEGGFARKVEALYDRYSKRYLPDGTDRRAWLDGTAGIRSSLREELIEVYREARIPSDRVAWLVRHQVADLRRQWQSGSFGDFRDRLQAPLMARVQCVVGLVVVALAGLRTVPAVVSARPLDGVIAVVLVVVAGLPVRTGVWRILVERRRFDLDEKENRERLDRYWVAFERWSRKLQRRPGDREMAAWLDADRKVFVDGAIRHHRLRPSDVIAHAVLEAPAMAYRRARHAPGPWRYSDYVFLVFLLTKDGVRHVTATLDTLKGDFRDRRRMNYRFDAIASVGVVDTGISGQTFELTLVNGHPTTVAVTADGTDGTDEESLGLGEVTLDSSGLRTTLHLLEGVAAEGKGWIEQGTRRAGHRLDVLTAAVRDLLDVDRASRRDRPGVG